MIATVRFAERTKSAVRPASAFASCRRRPLDSCSTSLGGWTGARCERARPFSTLRQRALVSRTASLWNDDTLRQHQGLLVSGTTLNHTDASCRWFSSSTAVFMADDDEGDYRTFRRAGMRNVAIVAHVDHGKTTLVDQLLTAAQQSMPNNDDSKAVALDRLMDSGDLEKERGITITSKVTRVQYHSQSHNNGEGPVVLNIVDTPGHADFSGEVDRILSMVDGVCLLVDAAEGPMTQTKYVLSRALAANLQPIVLLNKCDRPEALTKLDSGETESDLAKLFESLGATKEQKAYTTLYASAREGWVVVEDPFQALEFATEGKEAVLAGMAEDEDAEEYSMKQVLDAILEHIPEPSVRSYKESREDGGDSDASVDPTIFNDDKFSMAVVSVGADPYLGRTATGRIVSGSVAVGDNLTLLPRDVGPDESSSITPLPTSATTGLFYYEGVSRKAFPDKTRALAGDCVTIAGVPDAVAVGDTLTSSNNPIDAPIETPPLAPPTLSMDFGANNGPLAGQEGTIIASSKIRDRLVAETDNNVTLKVSKSEVDAEKTVVYARGELQLGILVEQMRREGFEVLISPPRVLTVTDPDTQEVLEPFEEVIVDVDAEFSGTVVSALTGERKATLMEMAENTADGKSRLRLEVPSRGLLGFSAEIATTTKGSAVVNHYFLENRPHVGPLESSLGKSKLVCNASGKATAHALMSLAARGVLFAAPGDQVYSGMVIGENAKTGPDLEVNAVRAKEVTNMRTQAKDEKVQLPPPTKMTLEELIGYMAEDEMIEVTPKNIRLRKALLDPSERERAAKTKNKQLRSLKK